MYTVGVFANISELTTFPFANIKAFAEKYFSQRDTYEFSLFTKDQKELFVAKVQIGEFDGIVFSTNVTTDEPVKNYFESRREVFSDFLNSGGGILILLQYHLAIANSAFDILSPTDFPGLINTPVITRANNDRNNRPIQYSRRKILCNDKYYILKYPRKVLDDGPYSLYESMEHNHWHVGPSPLFACISDYPRSDFYSLIDYYNVSDFSYNESFCIVSRNVNKRVIISTLAFDLEESFALENLITYIAKGQPVVFFKACDRCVSSKGSCDFHDLLNNTKIHFTDDDGIKNMTKYEVFSCPQVEGIVYEKAEDDSVESILPIKQLVPITTTGQISRTIDVSAVKYMCKLGAQYLRTQLNGGKYGSLIGTLTTLRFFRLINVSISDDDQHSILEYLRKHNKDKRSFDSVNTPTIIANSILDILEYSKDDIHFESKSQIEHLPTLSLIDCEQKEISSIARVLGQDDCAIETCIEDCTEYDLKELLLKLFARIISSRDKGRISWENDCYMTSTMLIVLLKIEQWLFRYDKKHHSTCVSKINVIAAYFEETTEKDLYAALVLNADNEREKAHILSESLIEEKKINNDLRIENQKLKEEEKDFETLENNIRKHKIISIILLFTMICVIVLFGEIVLRAQLSHDNLYDFVMNISPLEIILSLAGLIVVPYTIGSIYLSNKTHSK